MSFLFLDTTMTRKDLKCAIIILDTELESLVTGTGENFDSEEQEMG